MSNEEKNLAIMTMRRRDKKLYDTIMHTKKRIRFRVSKLLCSWEMSTKIFQKEKKTLSCPQK